MPTLGHSKTMRAWFLPDGLANLEATVMGTLALASSLPLGPSCLGRIKIDCQVVMAIRADIRDRDPSSVG